MPAGGWRGWAGPVLVTLIAAVLRLVDLGRPNAIAFDETYYVKDGLSLLLFGYERGSVDGADKIILDTGGGASGLTSIFKPDASFVVHPPVGKWVIASGEQVFGVTPFGWRIAVAVLGTISILMVARIARRLTRSNLVGILAGFLLALDGMHLEIEHERASRNLAKPRRCWDRPYGGGPGGWWQVYAWDSHVASSGAACISWWRSAC